MCILLAAGMSSAAVQGMVAAYTSATSVNLARCAGQLRHTVDFANMFSAVSRGAAARVQGQPLEKLQLKGCIALRTDDVANICENIDTLRYRLHQLIWNYMPRLSAFHKLSKLTAVFAYSRVTFWQRE